MNPNPRCPQCGVRLAADAPDGLCPRCLMQGALGELPVSNSQEGSYTSPWKGAAAPPTVKELAPLFPQLEILQLVGRGGMGAVYQARHVNLDRLVALKILPPDVPADPTFAERFTREARALAKLNHPNIVAVYDSGQIGDLYYFIMEYIDGVDLRQAIQAGELTAAQALAIVPQVCDALQYAHDEGVVHRDIKPENVLLDKKGRVKVADFGLAKLLGRAPIELTLTSAHQVLGTLHYMAPEQIESPFRVDHRADIYSLGVVFYELLTGELPLGRFKLPSEAAVLDSRLDEVVLKTLEKRPDERYQHASQVKSDVEHISHHQTLGAAAEQVSLAKSHSSPSTSRRRGQAVSRQQASGRRAKSCPFSIGSLHGGLAKAMGLVRVEEKGLALEFEVKDEIFGWLRSGPKTVVIPWDEIVSIGLHSRWLSNKIEVQTDRLVTASDVPASDRGRFSLEVSRRDLEIAQNVVDAAQRMAGLSTEDRSAVIHTRGASRAPGSEKSLSEMRRIVKGPATGLMIGGFINLLVGFGLTLGFLIASIEDEDLIGGVVTFVLTIPVGGLMILAGWNLSRLRRRVLCNLGIIAAMLPVTPFVFVTVFVGMRAWWITRRHEVQEAFRLHDGDFDSGDESQFHVPTEKDAPPEKKLGGQTPPRRNPVAVEDLSNVYVVVNGPGWALIGLGLFSILFPLGFEAILVALYKARFFRSDDLLTLGIPFFFSLPAGIVMLVGGASMKRLGSRSMAKAAAVAALIPLGPQFLANLPIALWALSVLRRPDVNAAFDGDVGFSPEDANQAERRFDNMQVAVTREQIKGVGVGLILLGVLNILLPLCVEGVLLFAVEARILRDDDILTVGIPLFFGLPLGILMLLGGWRMKRLSSNALAKVGLIAAMIPCTPLWLLSFPYALRGWAILRKPAAREAFSK